MFHPTSKHCKYYSTALPLKLQTFTLGFDSPTDPYWAAFAPELMSLATSWPPRFDGFGFLYFYFDVMTVCDIRDLVSCVRRTCGHTPTGLPKALGLEWLLPRGEDCVVDVACLPHFWQSELVKSPFTIGRETATSYDGSSKLTKFVSDRRTLFKERDRRPLPLAVAVATRPYQGFPKLDLPKSLRPSRPAGGCRCGDNERPPWVLSR